MRDRPLPRPSRPESNWRQLDFETEVRQAIAAGLDGFILEMTWRETHADERWNQTAAMLDAAHSVDPEFRILLAPGFPTSGETHEELRDTILRFAEHPAVLRLPDGRLPLSTFYPERPTASGGKPLSWWASLWDDLEDRGWDVAWVPHFLSRTSRNELADLQGWHDMIAGYSIWDGKFVSQASFNVSEAEYARERGLLWFAHALFQDVRLRKANLVELRHWEPTNSATFRAFFEAAIAADADWLSIITWNDYGETQIAPSVARGHAIVDLLAYYTTWMKLGEPPPIVRDALYYFHRRQPVAAPYDATQQTAGAYEIPAGPSGQDEIELLAFLADDGRLSITQGETVETLDVEGAGMVSFVVPLVAGETPVFELTRQGQPVVSLSSVTSVQAEVVYQDMTIQAGGSIQCDRPD